MQRRQSTGTGAGGGGAGSPLLNLLQGAVGVAGQDKAAKQALYHALALLSVTGACWCCWALCQVLEPFFRPLVWAGLVGCLLHPLKRAVAKGLTRWLQTHSPSSSNLLLALLFSPLHLTDCTLRTLDSSVAKYWKIGLGLIIGILGIFGMLHVFPWRYLYFVVTISTYINAIFVFFLDRCNTLVFATFLTIYLSLLTFIWSSEKQNGFRKSSILVWLFSTAYVSNLTGSLKSVTFIGLQFLAVLGFLIEIKEIYDSKPDEKNLNSLCGAFVQVITNKPHGNQPESNESKDKDDEEHTSVENIEKDSNVDEVENYSPLPSRSRLVKGRTFTSLPLNSLETRSTIENQIVAALQRKALKKETELQESSFLQSIQKSESSVYIKILIWACILMSLWKNSWLWPLIIILILVYFVKAIANFFGIGNFLFNITGNIKNDLYIWFNDRYYALMPAHITGIIKIFDKINTNLYNIAINSVDSVATCAVIVCLILFFTCAPIFLGVQIYSEGINVVQLTGSLINRTVVHNPELRQLLPPGWDETLDSLLDNAYVYGREGLSKAIKGVLHDADSEKSIKIEKQLLELWDRVYQTWMTHNNDAIGPNVDVGAIEQTWKSFISDITKTPGMLNTNGIIDFAKQNVGTLMSLLESIWSLLKGNLTLVFGSLSAVSSILLGGGSAVLNFLLSLIVFFTTLFYLLDSSKTLYKPIELITKLSPINGSQFGLAMTDAVNGVFIATLKMAFFYGLWTWLIHSLFGAKIVYLPSALAAILAAVPFLGTYLACIPAVLDLWLAQDAPILAILLAICQFAPTSYVDTVIYKEIKNGGHPYFTGLAIAGGIFCLGVEGAIFGPLLLCCLLVAFNLSSTLFKDTPLEEQLSAATLQSQLNA